MLDTCSLLNEAALPHSFGKACFASEFITRAFSFLHLYISLHLLISNRFCHFVQMLKLEWWQLEIPSWYHVSSYILAYFEQLGSSMIECTQLFQDLIHLNLNGSFLLHIFFHFQLGCAHGKYYGNNGQGHSLVWLPRFWVFSGTQKETNKLTLSGAHGI